WTSTSYTIPLNTWTHLEFVSTSSTLTVYANGSQVYSTSSDHFSNLNSYFDLATWGQSVGWFHGSMDELRVSSTNRSGDWITTEYNNQSSPSTFYSISAASGGGGNQSPVANAGGPYSGTAGSALQLNG